MYDNLLDTLTLFLWIVLRIPNAHNFCVISARSRARADTQHIKNWLDLGKTSHLFFLLNQYRAPTIILFSFNTEITLFLSFYTGNIDQFLLQSFKLLLNICALNNNTCLKQIESLLAKYGCLYNEKHTKLLHNNDTVHPLMFFSLNFLRFSLISQA